MIEPLDPIDAIAALMEDAEFDDPDDARAARRLVAQLALALDVDENDAAPSDDRLAALVDGRLEPAAALRWLEGAQSPARAEAALAFVAAGGAKAQPVPSHLAVAARARLGFGKIIPLAGAARPVPPPETFLPLAAASGSMDQAIVRHSRTGLWTLETFPGMSAADRAAGRASLLITMNPEHAASYEGLTMRAFVTIGGEERVLAEAVVHDGSAFAEISLAGLDLRTRDAVSVVFIAPDSA